MKHKHFAGRVPAIAATLAGTLLLLATAIVSHAQVPAGKAQVPAEKNAGDNTGKATFERYCASCHAPGHGHPGTQQLGWTRGQAAAVLQERQNLTQAYVKHVVRHGLLEMPPYRPSEIDDAALDALARYLAKN